MYVYDKTKYQKPKLAALILLAAGFFVASLATIIVDPQTANAISGFSYDKKIQLSDDALSGDLGGLFYGTRYFVDSDGEIIFQSYSNYTINYYGADGVLQGNIDLRDRMENSEGDVHYYFTHPHATPTFTSDGSTYYQVYQQTNESTMSGVLRLSPKTADIMEFYPVPEGNESAATYLKAPTVDSDGNVYIISRDGLENTSLLVYKKNGDVVRDVMIDGTLSASYFSQFSISDDKRYIYSLGYDDEGRSIVGRIDSQTGDSKRIDYQGDSFYILSEDGDLQADHSGNFYLIGYKDDDQGQGEIQLRKYSEDGELLGENSLRGNYPDNSGMMYNPLPIVTFDSNDNVYVRTRAYDEEVGEYREILAFDCNFNPIGELSFQDLSPYANESAKESGAFYDNAPSAVILTNDKLYWTASDPVSDEDYMRQAIFVFNLPNSPTCEEETPPVVPIPEEGNSSTGLIEVPNTGSL